MSDVTIEDVIEHLLNVGERDGWMGVTRRQYLEASRNGLAVMWERGEFGSKKYFVACEDGVH